MGETPQRERVSRFVQQGQLRVTRGLTMATRVDKLPVPPWAPQLRLPALYFLVPPHHPLGLSSEAPSLGQDPSISPHTLSLVHGAPGVVCSEMILCRFGPLFSP